MRKGFLLALAVVACAKAETPPADTAAAAPTPAAPAALTPADLSGTWTGSGTREGSDSVTQFSVVNTSDSTGKLVIAGRTDSVATTSRFDADSVIVTSAPYKDPTMPKNAPDVVFRSIGRLRDGKLVGIAYISPAAKRDTVIARVNWELTKVP